MFDVSDTSQFEDVLDQAISNSVDEMIDEGYDAKQTSSKQMEVTTTADYDSSDIEKKLEEEFPESKEDIGGGVSWLPEYFKFETMKDEKVCEVCRSFADKANLEEAGIPIKMTLRRDGTGNLHTGGDEDVIEFLIEESGWTVQDLAHSPQSVQLNLHASQKGEKMGASCRCILKHIT
jgi:hypothetical protein